MQGFGAKLGFAIGNYFESMSPTMGKHTMAAMGMPRGVRMGQGGFTDAVDAGTDYLKKLGGAWSAMSSEFSMGQRTSNYFRGGNVEDLLYSKASGTTGGALESLGILPTAGRGLLSASEIMQQRSWNRIGTTAAAGAVGLNQVFAGDSAVGGAVGFAAKAGMHAGVGYGARALGHPKVGMGYWGLAGINMIRSGDNYGPF